MLKFLSRWYSKAQMFFEIGENGVATSFNNMMMTPHKRIMAQEQTQGNGMQEEESSNGDGTVRGWNRLFAQFSKNFAKSSRIFGGSVLEMIGISKFLGRLQ